MAASTCSWWRAGTDRRTRSRATTSSPTRSPRADAAARLAADARETPQASAAPAGRRREQRLCQRHAPAGERVALGLEQHGDEEGMIRELDGTRLAQGVLRDDVQRAADQRGAEGRV